MQPKEYLELADKLITINKPAHLRSCISRAYYSTFHTSIQTLRALGFTISDTCAHGEPIRLLSYSKQTKPVSSKMFDLQGWRVKADYRLDRTDVETVQTAELRLSEAKKIVAGIEDCLKSPQKEEVTKEIGETLKKLNP